MKTNYFKKRLEKRLSKQKLQSKASKPRKLSLLLQPYLHFAFSLLISQYVYISSLTIPELSFTNFSENQFHYRCFCLPFCDTHSHQKKFNCLQIKKDQKIIALGLKFYIALTSMAPQWPKMYTAASRRNRVW